MRIKAIRTIRGSPADCSDSIRRIESSEKGIRHPRISILSDASAGPSDPLGALTRWRAFEGGFDLK